MLSIPDLSKPNLRGLAFLLRHPDRWPRDFGRWEYRSNCYCAAALAESFWNIPTCGSGNVGEALNLTDEESDKLFYNDRMNNHIVSPEEVAVWVDEVALAHGE